MEKIKMPLGILTGCFAVSFFDGFFGWGVSEGIYEIVGLIMIGSFVYLWYLVTTNE